MKAPSQKKNKKKKKSIVFEYDATYPTARYSKCSMIALDAEIHGAATF